MGGWRPAVLVVALAALSALPGSPAQTDSTLSAVEIHAMTDEGENDEAAEAARILLETAEAEHGPRSLPIAEALELLARALARAHPGDTEGKPGRLGMAERALKIRQELSKGDDMALAWSYYVVGLVHNLVLESTLALEPFDHALKIAEAHHGKDHPATEVYVREYGTAVFGVGRFRDALDLFERYRAIAVAKHGEGHPATLPAFFNVSLTHLVLGRLEESDRHLRIAEDILERQDPIDAHHLVRVRSLRATILALQGRLADSLSMFQENLAMALESLGPDSQEVIRLKNYLGRNLIDLGDYERARDLLSRALEEHGPASPVLLRCSMLYNLASAHHALGELQAARGLYETLMRDAARVIDPDHVSWGEYREGYAATLHELGDSAGAREQIDLALNIRRERDENSLHDAETLIQSGNLSLAMGDPATAQEELRRAIKIIGTHAPSSPRYYVANEDLAEALFAAGEFGPAFQAAVQAASASTEFDRATIALLSRRQAMVLALRPHIARDVATTLVLSPGMAPVFWKREVYELLLRSRAMVLDEMAARERRWADTGNPEVLARIDEWMAARRRVANLFMVGPRDKVEYYVARLDAAQRTIERLELELAQVSREHRDLFQQRDAGFEAVRATLKPGEALVSYVRFGMMTSGSRQRLPHYAAVVLRGKDQNPAWFDLGPAEDIERTITEWRSMFDPAQLKSAGEQAYRRVGHALTRMLWDPLKAHLADTKTVFVVPDAAVHLVSFIALPVGKENYLIDNGPVFHYLTAERDLIRAEQPEERLNVGLLVVGNPAFNAKDTSPSGEVYRGTSPTCASFRSRTFGLLPGTKREARVVRKLWASGVDEPVAELSGARATEGAVKKAMTGRRVIHLATHGFFLGGNCSPGNETYRGIGTMSPRRRPENVAAPRIANPLLMSGLVFAGANRRAFREGVDGEDGVLTAEEVGTLDLRGVELAVLSACETGAGSVTEGEGMFGLRRAFLIAGAETVVTNLWNVEDRAARIWIERLYRERFLVKRSMPEAMRSASRHVLNMRRKADLDTHPFYWAGWLAVGAR